MKGLLIKDLCLLRSQRRLLPIFVLLAIWFTAMYSDSFVFPYLTMMAAILTDGTISYDEADRGQTHLFSLPFDRRTYVTEKFLLGALMLAAAMALAYTCSLVRGLIVHDAGPATVGVSFVLSACIGAVTLAVMIPTRIRFGGDQSRIILFAAVALVVLACVALTRLLPGTLEQLVYFLAGAGRGSILLLAAAAAALPAAAGYALAVHWLGKKEF